MVRYQLRLQKKNQNKEKEIAYQINGNTLLQMLANSVTLSLECIHFNFFFMEAQ